MDGVGACAAHSLIYAVGVQWLVTRGKSAAKGALVVAVGVCVARAGWEGVSDASMTPVGVPEGTGVRVVVGAAVGTAVWVAVGLVVSVGVALGVGGVMVGGGVAVCVGV